MNLIWSTETFVNEAPLSVKGPKPSCSFELNSCIISKLPDSSVTAKLLELDAELLSIFRSLDR